MLITDTTLSAMQQESREKKYLISYLKIQFQEVSLNVYIKSE